MAAVLLQSLIFLLQPPKPAPAGLPAPSSRGWLCCRQAIRTACSLLPWLAVLPPGHPSNHPHILLFSGDVSLTPQPTSQRSFFPQRGHPLRWLRRLWVVLFLGLALVHRVCALSAARSTWSTNNSHRERLTVGAHTLWLLWRRRSFSPQRGHPLRWLRRLRVVLFLGLSLVHRVCALGAARSTWSTNNSHRKRLTVGAHTGKCLLITRKIMIPPPDSWDPPEGPTQENASLLHAK